MLAWTLLILSRGRYATQACASHICLLRGSLQSVFLWIAFECFFGVILLTLALYILTLKAACLCWPVYGLAHFIIDGSIQHHNFTAHRGCCCYNAQMTRSELTLYSAWSHMHVAQLIACSLQCQSACIPSLCCCAGNVVKHSQDSADLVFVCHAKICIVVDNVVLCRHMSSLNKLTVKATPAAQGCTYLTLGEDICETIEGIYETIESIYETVECMNVVCF